MDEEEDSLLEEGEEEAALEEALEEASEEEAEDATEEESTELMEDSSLEDAEGEEEVAGSPPQEASKKATRDKTKGFFIIRPRMGWRCTSCRLLCRF